MSTAVEHRFNLNSLRGDGFGNLPALTKQGDDPSLTYTRMAGGTNLWKTQFSSDLSNWTDAIEDTHVKTTTGESGLPGDVLQTMTVTIIAGTSQSPLYWRVAIPEE